MQSDLAFLFPGQGSQRIGMLAEAYERSGVVRDTFTEASDSLGYDVWALVSDGDAAQLNLTEFTQPVLLTSSVALWRFWCAEDGATPAALAGHSLGEFSALCCADSLTLTDAVRLVRERGRFMQTAVPVGEGAMAAIIGLDDETVTGTCAAVSEQHDAIVQAVNFNSPGQVVIAGQAQAVETAQAALKEAGAKRAMPLPVSAPFHTTLMKPAGDRLAEVLADVELKAPAIPVVHNVHAAVETDAARIRQLLIEQISAPVLWTRCMATLEQMGIQRLGECGPGKVLGGLARRINKSLSCTYLEQPDDLLGAAHP